MYIRAAVLAGLWLSHPYRHEDLLNLKETASSFVANELLSTIAFGKVMEKDGKIYIDGKSSSQYIPKQRFYYMEGDNRMNSHDSRSFGFISEEAIIGKFDFVLFSITFPPSRKINER